MAEGDAALARAVSDEDDRLVSADELLASLQRRCGGEIPGTIAVPALLDLVARSRRYGMKLARPISAQDGTQAIAAWIEVEPRRDGESGCRIAVRDWQVSPLPDESPASAALGALIDRDLAEYTARLDSHQRVLAVTSAAPDMAALARAMGEGAGRLWTEFVAVEGQSDVEAMHWRLLDGAKVTAEGSERAWRAGLAPIATPGAPIQGFELFLTADAPLPQPARTEATEARAQAAATIGRDVAPVLRQPIARIIANAETIRARLAGPLDDTYARYAADIAAAGQHLLGLLEDLTALEVIEADEFQPAPDRIDLGDVARQAAGILGVRARDQGIIVDPPKLGESLPAVGEFRRVLQVLLNLIGNAIRYSPENSQVWIRLEDIGDRARVIVADQGPGLAPEQQERVFEKFERLGRSGDGGSGLGLYISRRLARAMGGELSVESAAGQGARFILELPADPTGSGQPAPAEPDEDTAG